MCWASKCCYCVSLDFGCILIAAIHFVVSLATLVLAIISLYEVSASDAAHEKTNGTLQTVHNHVTDNDQNYSFSQELLKIKHESLNVALGVILCLCACGLLCSPLLVYGLRKNKPGFVISYFTYGTILVIILLISALLELLKGLWITSFVQFTVSMIYIHCLVAVHSVYELMQRGKVFGSNDHSVLTDEVDSIN